MIKLLLSLIIFIGEPEKIINKEFGITVVAQSNISLGGLSTDLPEGYRIIEVRDNSPAYSTGIKEHDIIIGYTYRDKFRNRPPKFIRFDKKTLMHLSSMIAPVNGNHYLIHVYRPKEKQTALLKFMFDSNQQDWPNKDLGLQLVEIDQKVKIFHVFEFLPAEKYGLKDDDIIIGCELRLSDDFNGKVKRINTLNEFERYLKETKKIYLYHAEADILGIGQISERTKAMKIAIHVNRKNICLTLTIPVYEFTD